MPGRRLGDRLAGLIRLIHPFPSLLDGVATAAIAWLAGGEPSTALRLGASMFALQASIGTLNDLVDEVADAGRKPGKPIPAGVVSRIEARVTLLLCAGAGLFLAAVSGPGLLAIAIVVLLVGYGYDFLAKGTAWSWLPFSVGIPLLPVFGWFGAVGSLPVSFMILLPAAVAAGAGLAIANARADFERDIDAGLDSVAVRLGMTRAWYIEAILLGAVALVALGWLMVGEASAVARLATGGATLVIAGGLAWGRNAGVHRRQRAWEVEAIGVAMLAVAWLTGQAGLG